LYTEEQTAFSRLEAIEPNLLLDEITWKLFTYLKSVECYLLN
jgi:hypothetical protein